MSEAPGRRWFTVTPHHYSDDDPAFWYRDVGSLCLTLRKLGVDSKFVAYGEPVIREDRPLILCRPSEMASAAWWRQWRLDGVIFTSWGSPRYEPVARAIHEAGARLIVRLDTDGVKSPRVDFLRYLYITRHALRDAGGWFPSVQAVLKTLLLWMAPGVHDQRMCRHLEHADRVLAESPLAEQSMRRLLHTLGRPDLAAKMRMVPHPARDEMSYDEGTPKRPVILAVGRWDAVQKDAPTLMRALGWTLPRHPEWSAVLIGPGTARLERLHARMPASTRDRITLAGRVDHGAMRTHYQESRVLLFASRYEGFPFAAGEALCCGCTVVGPGSVPAFNYVATEASGSLSCSRSPGSLSDALSVELAAWQAGRRDPVAISRQWRARLSESVVASALLRDDF